MAQQQDNGSMNWLSSLLGLGGGLGTAAGGLFNLFGPKQKNPADIANKYISQIPGQTQQYYSPYMQAGQGAMSDLQNRYKGLLSGDVQNQLAAGYKESPGYQRALQQALQSGSAAAAAGGMLGTPAHQEQNMELASDIASKDFNNYLQNQLGLYGLGLSGEQGLNQMGFEANKSMADTVGNALSQQGAYGYAGQAGQNAAKSQGIGNIFGGLGMGAASLFGGPGGASILKLLGLG